LQRIGVLFGTGRASDGPGRLAQNLAQNSVFFFFFLIQIEFIVINMLLDIVLPLLLCANSEFEPGLSRTRVPRRTHYHKTIIHIYLLVMIFPIDALQRRYVHSTTAKKALSLVI